MSKDNKFILGIVITAIVLFSLSVIALGICFGIVIEEMGKL